MIELLIVVAIIGILAMVAYPSYRQQVIKANRSAAQSAMLDIANREHQYFVANRAYLADGDLADNSDGGLFAMPGDLIAYYTGAIVLAAGPPPTFTITFTPVLGSAQDADGPLTLDAAGNKTPVEKWER